MNLQPPVYPLTAAQQQANRKVGELLRRSQLLSEERLTQVQEQLTREPYKEVFQQLLLAEFLTRWQVQRLLKGHTQFRLSRYTLLEFLGGGGMGEVFKARQDGLGRLVALKLMRPQTNGDDWVSRFRREFEHASRLRHPNIVAMLDAEYLPDRLMLVMEYVPGMDLNRLLKRFGRFPIPTACEFVRQAALGVQHAHEQGLVHRDLKPANLLLSHDERTGRPILKVLDLGLTRLATAPQTTPTDQVTQAGVIMGTTDFLAPEQIRNSQVAEYTSDVFSLCVTLFQLLTGALPYQGQGASERLVARVLEEATDVREYRPEIPSALARLVAWGLVRDPQQRLPSAQTLANALLPFTQYSPTDAAADTPSDQTAALLATSIGCSKMPTATDSDQTQPLQPERPHAVVEVAAAKFEPQQLLAFLESSQPLTSFTDHATATANKTNAPGITTISSENAKPIPPKPWSGWRLLALVLVLSSVTGLATYWHQTRTQQTLFTAAAIEILWRDEELKNVLLSIGEQAVVIPNGNSLRCPLPPGEHRLRLQRPEYQPIEITIKLQPGETLSYRPAWIRLPPMPLSPPPVVAQTEPVTTSEPVTTAAIETTPVPQDLPVWEQSTPVDDHFFYVVGQLSLSAQVKAVITKLQRLNPGYDGEHTVELKNETIFLLHISSVALEDISPIPALASLQCLSLTVDAKRGELGRLQNLAPLQNMKLIFLDISNTRVNNLLALQALPLQCLRMRNVLVTDLTPLRQLDLLEFAGSPNQNFNLEPLREMPLEIYEGPIATRAQWEVLTQISTLQTINAQPATAVLEHFPNPVPSTDP